MMVFIKVPNINIGSSITVRDNGAKSARFKSSHGYVDANL